jgi:hypothetical protein
VKVTLRPASRLPKVPLWALGFVVLWAMVVIWARIIGHYTGTEPDLCLFHRLTGYPSPTCGTTRGLLAMARGAWRESLAWNPMTMTGALIGSVVVIGRLVAAKTLIFKFTPRDKRLLVTVALVIFGLNWVWLIYSQR